MPRVVEHLLGRLVDDVADEPEDDEEEPDVGHHEQEDAETQGRREHRPARLGVVPERVEGDRHGGRRLALALDDVLRMLRRGAQPLDARRRLGFAARSEAGVIGHTVILAYPRRRGDAADGSGGAAGGSAMMGR